jgi:hypothetical protein
VLTTLRTVPARLWAYHVSGLSEARFQKKVHASTVLRRAFDKAVRRKPPVVAADAVPMQIQLGEGAVSRCTGAVRQSTTDDTGR